MILLFQTRSDILSNKSGRRKDHYFGCYFYDHLMDVTAGRQYKYSNVRRWLKFVEVFSRERVFIVINQNNFHFIAVVLYMTTHTIVIVDSLATKWSAFHRGVAKNLKKWLRDEWESKRGFAFDSERWTEELRSCPQQEDGKMCLFTSLMNLDLLAHDLPLRYTANNVFSTKFRRLCGISFLHKSYMLSGDTLDVRVTTPAPVKPFTGDCIDLLDSPHKGGNTTAPSISIPAIAVGDSSVPSKKSPCGELPKLPLDFENQGFKRSLPTSDSESSKRSKCGEEPLITGLEGENTSGIIIASLLATSPVIKGMGMLANFCFGTSKPATAAGGNPLLQDVSATTGTDNVPNVSSDVSATTGTDNVPNVSSDVSATTGTDNVPDVSSDVSATTGTDNATAVIITASKETASAKAAGGNPLEDIPICSTTANILQNSHAVLPHKERDLITVEEKKDKGRFDNSAARRERQNEFGASVGSSKKKRSSSDLSRQASPKKSRSSVAEISHTLNMGDNDKGLESSTGKPPAPVSVAVTGKPPAPASVAVTDKPPDPASVTVTDKPSAPASVAVTDKPSDPAAEPAAKKLKKTVMQKTVVPTVLEIRAGECRDLLGVGQTVKFSAIKELIVPLKKDNATKLNRLDTTIAATYNERRGDILTFSAIQSGEAPALCITVLPKEYNGVNCWEMEIPRSLYFVKKTGSLVNYETIYTHRVKGFILDIEAFFRNMTCVGGTRELYAREYLTYDTSAYTEWEVKALKECCLKLGFESGDKRFIDKVVKPLLPEPAKRKVKVISDGSQ